MLRLNNAQPQPIGLDIGHDGIKMLQMEVTPGNSLAVVAAARCVFPGEVRGDHGLRMASAVDLIKRTLRQQPFRGREVVAALPREIVHVKNLRLPQMPPAEIEQAVQFEAPNVFPFAVDKAKIHYLPAGEVRQGADVRQEVIVFAVKNDDVNNYLELLHRAGVVVRSLDIEPCALFRTVDRFIRRREDEQQVTVLVDVGWRRSQVVIGRGRDINFVKPVEIGGHQLQEAVAKKLGITAEEAQALRQRLCESEASGEETGGRRDPVRQSVFDATRAIAEELGREIALCLRYYSVAFRGQRPGRLRLVGGEASNTQLQQILNAVLPIPAEIGKPLCSTDTSRMRAVDRQGPMSEWALALGLSLKMAKGPFAPRDGTPRDRNAPAVEVTPSGVQVMDADQLVRSISGPVGNEPAGRSVGAVKEPVLAGEVTNA
ncbi:MAG TPA: type IV pilus assembly protein PilM [Tepidisphaeraceae bacterium]|jgi:type IV pilus assembly protein PilM|nr:type IV pilus assembly protein PilM [Tepidisphaeraceae bacterium]